MKITVDLLCITFYYTYYNCVNLNLRSGLAVCGPLEPMLPCCLLDDVPTPIVKTNAFSRRNRN